MEMFYSLYAKINLPNVIGNIISPLTYTNKTLIKNNYDNREKELCPEIRITIRESNLIDIESAEPSLNLMNFNNLYDSNQSYESIDIPTGIVYSIYYPLEWKRQYANSDYQVKYKGITYIINQNSINKIYSKTNTNINEILQLFIQNNFDENITLCHLLV